MSGAGQVYTPHATERMESLAGLPLASFGARAGAYAIDMVLVVILWWPLTALTIWLTHLHEKNLHIDLKWDFHEPSNIVFALLYFGLSQYFGNGRTLGKRLMRIAWCRWCMIGLPWQAMERALRVWRVDSGGRVRVLPVLHQSESLLLA